MSEPHTISSTWSFSSKFSFRFFCCFFIIYIFPFPLDSIPFVPEIGKINENLTAWYNKIFEAYGDLWHAIIPWIGAKVLHISYPITIFTNGSGDTTYDYVTLLTFFSLSLLGALVWSLLDRNRRSYDRGYYWLRVLVRYYLGYTMLIYGFIKIFHLQMPSPYLSQLVQPLGDKSPMGLAWTFMGYSKAFSAYTGWGEVIGGLLLFWRRTTSLGALISVIVMSSVVAMNYSFDIPVKIYSSILFIGALFLLTPDFKRLANVLVWNRPTEPVVYPEMLHKPWQKKLRLVLKYVFIGYMLYYNISSCLKNQHEYGDYRVKPALYGIYNSELLVRNNDTIPPLTTDTTMWKQIVIQFDKAATIKMMNDSMRRMSFIVDTTARSVTVFKPNDTLNKSKLFYTIDSVCLTLNGNYRGDSVMMRFRKYDLNRFLLLNRGYNWVNERPLNR